MLAAFTVPQIVILSAKVGSHDTCKKPDGILRSAQDDSSFLRPLFRWAVRISSAVKMLLKTEFSSKPFPLLLFVIGYAMIFPVVSTCLYPSVTSKMIF